MHVAHSQHLSSSYFDFHSQQLPDQVCVTEATYHLELDMSFLLCICGKSYIYWLILRSVEQTHLVSHQL